MIRLPANLPAHLALSITIFLALIAVYWLFVGKPRTQVDVSLAYMELTSALGSQNLLPPVGDDTVLTSLSSMTYDVRRIRIPQSGSGGLSELGLGDVLTARANDAEVFRVELKPQQWRELMPGPLREALRKIARSELSLQQNSPEVYRAQPGSPLFGFRSSYNGRRYECIPVFEQDDCILISVSEVRE